MEGNNSFNDLIRISEYIKQDVDNKTIAYNMGYNDSEYIEYLLTSIDKNYNKKIYSDSQLYLYFSVMYGITFICGPIVFLCKILEKT